MAVDCLIRPWPVRCTASHTQHKGNRRRASSRLRGIDCLPSRRRPSEPPANGGCRASLSTRTPVVTFSKVHSVLAGLQQPPAPLLFPEISTATAPPTLAAWSTRPRLASPRRTACFPSTRCIALHAPRRAPLRHRPARAAPRPPPAPPPALPCLLRDGPRAATSTGRRPPSPRPSRAMSVLPPEVHTALASLLQGLQSPDNVQRTAAEQQLNDEWVAQRPEVLLMGLSEQIELAQETPVRPRRPPPPPRVLTLPPDANLCRRHLQATVVQAAQDALGADGRPVSDPAGPRARRHPRKAAAVPRQRGRQLGPLQGRRCRRRARQTAHRRR